MTMMIEMTMATMGRFMKNLDMLFHQQRHGRVAQVSNLLYRSASSLLSVIQSEGVVQFPTSADWKSAIQQVGNLRYAANARLLFSGSLSIEGLFHFEIGAA